MILTDELVIRCLQEAAATSPSPLRQKDYMAVRARHSGWPSRAGIDRKYGWNAALELAGLPTRPRTGGRQGRGATSPPDGGHVTSRGYVQVYRCGKRVYQHRVVMEEHLGRPLYPDESVHHRKARDDNRLESLELRVKSHPHGLAVDEAVEWAREILRRYT